MKTTQATATAILSVLLAVPGGLSAQTIPDHPDKLTYKEFSYKPPTAKEYRHVLKAGPVAYVAEDHELPLVSVTVTLRGGTHQNPEGKEGLAELTGYLLARGGTKTRTAEELEEELAFLAANLASGYGDDRATVSLNLLSKDLDAGLKILREVMTEPRFQEDKLALRKEQILADMKTRNDDSADIEARERAFLAYGEGYAFNRYITRASLDSIKRDELVAFHQRWFDPKGMIVAISGDVKSDVALRKLEETFSRWPLKPQTAPPLPKPSHKMPPGLYIVDKDVNQGRVSVMLPGLVRTDPDYFAAELMNDALGGGGFSSRIVNRVRSDEGLAYSAGSTLAGGVWFPGIYRASFQSKVRTCAYATQIVLEEMKKFIDGGGTDSELETSKARYIETLPRRFGTKAQTLGVLVDEEYTGRYQTDPNYFANYRANVQKVTKADVSRAAARLLKGTPTILVVGKKEDLLNPDPKHPVKYPELAGGKVVDVPLRDPFTMKPVAPATK